MERGERSIAILTLSIISVVAVLGAVALFLRQPTGQVMQGTQVYQVVDAGQFGVTCTNLPQQIVYLGSEGRYEIYCCISDINGQNACRNPQRIFRT